MTTVPPLASRDSTAGAKGPVHRLWGWVLADGILGVLAGVVALVWPGVTLVILAVVLGISLIVQGAFEVAAAIGAPPGTAGRGWAGFLGVVTLVAGLICLLHPGAGLFAIALAVTVWFLVAGVNDILAGMSTPRDRVWHLFVGVVTIVCGVVMIAIPDLALSTVAVLAGVFFLLRGVGEISVAMRLRRAGG